MQKLREADVAHCSKNINYPVDEKYTTGKIPDRQKYFILRITLFDLYSSSQIKSFYQQEREFPSVISSSSKGRATKIGCIQGKAKKLINL